MLSSSGEADGGSSAAGTRRAGVTISWSTPSPLRKGKRNDAVGGGTIMTSPLVAAAPASGGGGAAGQYCDRLIPSRKDTALDDAYATLMEREREKHTPLPLFDPAGVAAYDPAAHTADRSASEPPPPSTELHLMQTLMQRELMGAAMQQHQKYMHDSTGNTSDQSDGDTASFTPAAASAAAGGLGYSAPPPTAPRTSVLQYTSPEMSATPAPPQPYSQSHHHRSPASSKAGEPVPVLPPTASPLRRGNNAGPALAAAAAADSSPLRSEALLFPTPPRSGGNSAGRGHRRRGSGRRYPSWSAVASASAASSSASDEALASMAAVSPNDDFVAEDEQTMEAGLNLADRLAATATSTLSVVSPANEALVRRTLAPAKVRTVSKVPLKILDAPGLADDFYLNLLDWSSANVIAVGLNATTATEASAAYLYNCSTSAINRLSLDAENAAQGEEVTGLAFSNDGSRLAVGSSFGTVSIWDVEASVCVERFASHGYGARVGSLSWNGSRLAAGGRDHEIHIYDAGRSSGAIATLNAHRQEVCGLRWTRDGSGYLASGGNDNLCTVWHEENMRHPVLVLQGHTAAVKALDWCPFERGILATGGGTADRSVRFWQGTTSGTCLRAVDTGSQVCQLRWSKSVKELVTTHGFSANEICLWRYPTMQPVAQLPGHVARVLYMSMSPTGEQIVTGAADESLRFWSIFPAPGRGAAGAATGLGTATAAGSGDGVEGATKGSSDASSAARHPHQRSPSLSTLTGGVIR